MTAATSFFVPGPAQNATGTGASNALEFLGYAQGGVRIREELLESPVHADYAGRQMPADKLLEGKLISVTVPLVRFDPVVLQHVLARFTGGTVGAIGANEIGTLALTEGKTFPFLCKFPYQTKTVFANNMPGIHIPNAYVMGGIELPVETKEQVIPLVFYGICSMNISTLAGTLWDQVMTGFPTID